MAKARKSEETIGVAGLREFRKALKTLGDQYPKELGQINKQLVASKLVPTARAKASSFRARNLAGGTARLGSKAVDTIRAGGGASQATIRAGGPKAPWLQGNEFGSKGRRRTRQFPAVKRNPTGYFLYPAIREVRPEIIDAYMVELEKLWNRVMPDGER